MRLNLENYIRNMKLKKIDRWTLSELIKHLKWVAEDESRVHEFLYCYCFTEEEKQKPEVKP